MFWDIFTFAFKTAACLRRKLLRVNEEEENKKIYIMIGKIEESIKKPCT